MLVLTSKVIRSSALIASLSLLAAGCYSANKNQAKEGQSHWLERCSSQADCSSDQICACGVCTIACEASSACGAGATCEQVAEQAACDGAPSGVASVCLRADRDIDIDLSSDAGNSAIDELDTLGSLPDRRVAVPTPIATGEEERMSEETESANQLAVALLWMPQPLEYLAPRFEPSGLCPEGSNVDYGGQVSQPVDVDVSLPLTVDISALERPPAEALVALDGGRVGGWTTGYLVLYRDGNGNGLLDPRNLEQGSPDEILGTSGDWGLQLGPTPNTISYVIYYSDETLPEYGPVIEAGFNVFRDDSSASGGERVAVPLDTPIPVPERDTPKVQTMNCEELCFAKDEFVCPATIAELPEDGEIECYPGSALWARTRCDGCFCFTATCLYEDESCPAD